MPRRNNLQDRNQRSIRKPKPVFYIATEGTKTERHYLNALFNRREYNYTLKFCKPDDSRTEPDQVLKKLEYEIPPKNQRRDSDQFWLVIDDDRRDPNKISAVVAQCKQSGYQIAVSNLCFEFWLFLHQQRPPTNTGAFCCDDYEPKLKQQIEGYQGKNNFDPEQLADKVELAQLHAKHRHEQYQQQNPRARWPQQEGLTTLYLLIEALKKAQ